MSSTQGLLAIADPLPPVAASTAAGRQVPWPPRLEGARFRLGREDLTAEVTAVLGLFRTHQQKRLDDLAVTGFVEACRSLASRVADERPSLADALAEAAGQLRAIHDSPLDIDDGVMSLLWENLGPELVPLGCPQQASTDHRESHETAASRQESDLDQFVSQISRMFLTIELLQGLESRLAEAHPMDLLVEELRHINRQLKMHSAAVERAVATLRPGSMAARVVDSLVIQHARQQYLIAFEYIVEIAQLERAEFQSVQGRRVVSRRGTTYDAIGLSEILGLEGSEADRPLVDAVLLRSGEGTLCLLVEHVLEHRKSVISPLDGILATSEKVSGVSPLGGGRLALVLNIPAMIRTLRG